jgi:hypothetical protein
MINRVPIDHPDLKTQAKGNATIVLVLLAALEIDPE